jgi:SNF2 family DNA or RNA helicase
MYQTNKRAHQILRQAEDRAHRIGVEHEVEVFYLVARGTLDESIWYLVLVTPTSDNA